MAELSSLFGELTKNVQIRIDKASELQKRLFDKVLYTRWLDWDSPTIGLDFEELVGKYNITVVAPTIGIDSKEPILQTEGIETIKKSVMNHALTLPLSMKDYRKILQILDSKSISDKQKTQQLVNIMWGNVQTVVNSVEGKLDMIFLGLLSNHGVFTFDENNNPEGPIRGGISMNFPQANLATAKTQWTEENIDTVDPMEDVFELIDAAEDKTSLSKILCAPSRISYMCRTKKMKQMIWGTDKSSKIVTLKDINEYMLSNDYPVFEKVRRRLRVQKGRQFLGYNPWNEKNLVGIPEGKLGTVKNAYSDNELKQESDVAYSNYGRIRISQWNVGETKGDNHGEFTKAESLSLPIITEGQDIYTLKTQL